VETSASSRRSQSPVTKAQEQRRQEVPASLANAVSALQPPHGSPLGPTGPVAPPQRTGSAQRLRSQGSLTDLPEELFRHFGAHLLDAETAALSKTNRALKKRIDSGLWGSLQAARDAEQVQTLEHFQGLLRRIKKELRADGDRTGPLHRLMYQIHRLPLAHRNRELAWVSWRLAVNKLGTDSRPAEPPRFQEIVLGYPSLRDAIRGGEDVGQVGLCCGILRLREILVHASPPEIERITRYAQIFATSCQQGFEHLGVRDVRQRNQRAIVMARSTAFMAVSMDAPEERRIHQETMQHAEQVSEACKEAFFAAYHSERERTGNTDLARVFAIANTPAYAAAKHAALCAVREGEHAGHVAFWYRDQGVLSGVLEQESVTHLAPDFAESAANAGENLRMVIDKRGITTQPRLIELFEKALGSTEPGPVVANLRSGIQKVRDFAWAQGLRTEDYLSALECAVVNVQFTRDQDALSFAQRYGITTESGLRRLGLQQSDLSAQDMPQPQS
jgi:hypothetical protein